MRKRKSGYRARSRYTFVSVVTLRSLPAGVCVGLSVDVAVRLCVCSVSALVSMEAPPLSARRSADVSISISISISVSVSAPVPVSVSVSVSVYVSDCFYVCVSLSHCCLGIWVCLGPGMVFVGVCVCFVLSLSFFLFMYLCL